MCWVIIVKPQCEGNVSCVYINLGNEFLKGRGGLNNRPFNQRVRHRSDWDFTFTRDDVWNTMTYTRVDIDVDDNIAPDTWVLPNEPIGCSSEYCRARV